MNIRMIKTLKELEVLRNYWEILQRHPNHDFSHYKLICQIRPEVECPCVMLLEKNKQPQALLIGRLERIQLAPSIGYFKPVRISAKVLTIIHQGFIGKFDIETAKESIQYLWSLLRSGLADAIEFHHLSDSSPLFWALLDFSPGWFCEKKSKFSKHWEMNLPKEGGFMKHNLKSKHRTRIRKKQRELESAFSGKISWSWMKHFDDVSGLCYRLEELAARTYQRGLGCGFINNEEFRQRFSLFARRGQLRVQLLEIDGKVRAFWLGPVYRGVFHSSETGYDPDLRNFEVGTQIFIRMADELMQEGVRKLDFGLGDAFYKNRFGDRCWQEKTVWLFAPSAKGIAVRSIMRLTFMIDSAARQIIENIKMTDRLKTCWRRRLAKGKT